MYLFMPLLCTNKTSLVEFQPNPEKNVNYTQFTKKL